MPDLANKEWTEIVGFEGRYFISITSEVFDTKLERYIKPHLSGVLRRNYHQVTLYLNGGKFTKRVHSLMGISWLGFVYGDRKMCIDHIDNNPLNNHLTNLQILTIKENNLKDRSKRIRKLTSKNVENFIYEYPTKNKEGFVGSEIKFILDKYKIDEDKFFEALGVNTCMMIGGEFVTYHCDILKGLRCVIEKREQTFEEWD